jgi:hypothetical protein
VRAVLVLAAFFAIGAYSIVRGAFWSESVDLVPVVLGTVCVVCGVGSTRVLIRELRRR